MMNWMVTVWLLIDVQRMTVCEAFQNVNVGKKEKKNLAAGIVPAQIRSPTMESALWIGAHALLAGLACATDHIIFNVDVGGRLVCVCEMCAMCDVVYVTCV